jgi:hypothetical protein
MIQNSLSAVHYDNRNKILCNRIHPGPGGTVLSSLVSRISGYLQLSALHRSHQSGTQFFDGHPTLHYRDGNLTYGTKCHNELKSHVTQSSV